MQSAAMYLAAFSLLVLHVSTAFASVLFILVLLALVISTPLAKLVNIGLLFTGLLLFQTLMQSTAFNWSATAVQTIQVKLGLFFMPWFIAANPSKKSLAGSIFIFALGMTWLSVPAVFNYFAHFNFWNEMIEQSKPLAIYSNIYHIEYSFLLSLSAVSCFYVRRLPQAIPVIYLRILGVVLLLCLHVLSTRTGLVAAYIGLLPAVYSLWQGKDKKGKLVFGLSAVIAIIGLFLVPSIQHRIANSIQDAQTVINQEKVNNKSFGQRFVTWQASWQLIKEKPYFGYGLDGTKAAIDAKIESGNFNIDSYFVVAPHNTYIELSLQSGIWAGMAFLLFFIGLFYLGYKYKNTYIIALGMAILMACVFENLIERQAGVFAITVFVMFASSVKSVEQKAVES